MGSEGWLAESQLAEEDTSWKMDLPRDTGPAEEGAEEGAVAATAPHTYRHMH